MVKASAGLVQAQGEHSIANPALDWCGQSQDRVSAKLRGSIKLHTPPCGCVVKAAAGLEQDKNDRGSVEHTPPSSGVAKAATGESHCTRQCSYEKTNAGEEFCGLSEPE